LIPRAELEHLMTELDARRHRLLKSRKSDLLAGAALREQTARIGAHVSAPVEEGRVQHQQLEQSDAIADFLSAGSEYALNVWARALVFTDKNGAVACSSRGAPSLRVSACQDANVKLREIAHRLVDSDDESWLISATGGR